ncbi:hypothetical protein ACTXIZ_11320 [Psychrobacter celer]|uniref:hypothetical protein n=2 Tax=Psychrobacter celer TaxID=306572 RepID=UPI003FD3E677
MKSTDNSKYILIRRAIVFIAYETNWSISRTVDWLLARDFERDIRSYEETDGSYHKINNEETGFDIATKYLFKRVTIGGHGELYNEKKDFDKAYYRIDDLNNNSLLDRLDLDFHQIYNYCYSTDKDGYVTALNTNLCDIADELKVMVIPTPAVRPAKPDLLEQYQIELEQLASNSYEYTRQKNIQLDIKLTTANEKITHLKNQFKQAKAEQADAPADDKEPSGIAKYNANKAYVIATSQALASYLWSMDTTQAIRTGDMVQQVRHVMHSVAPDLLPDDKAIRGWLSDIAPDYAKKGGKTPKDTPSEISLTMKK